MKFILPLVAILMMACSPQNAGLYKASSPQFRTKYIDFLDQDEKILNSWYHYVTTVNSEGAYIQRTFYPETRQITAKRVFADQKMKTPHGEQTFWNENGNMKRKGSMTNGKAEGKWEYFHRTTGSIRESGEYLNNKRNGAWQEYDSEGRLTKTVNYVNDLKVGDFTEYDSLGVVINEGIYEADKISSQTKVVEPKSAGVEKMPYLKFCSNIEDETEKNACSQQTLINYVYKTLKYPTRARKYGIEGTALVQFVISKEGAVKDVDVLIGLCEDIKHECEKLANNLPQWVPGIQDGKAVDVVFTLPVKFKLEYY